MLTNFYGALFIEPLWFQLIGPEHFNQLIIILVWKPFLVLWKVSTTISTWDFQLWAAKMDAVFDISVNRQLSRRLILLLILFSPIRNKNAIKPAQRRK